MRKFWILLKTLLPNSVHSFGDLGLDSGGGGKSFRLFRPGGGLFGGRKGKIGSFGDDGASSAPLVSRESKRQFFHLLGFLLILFYSAFTGTIYSRNLIRSGQIEALPRLISLALPLATLLFGIISAISILYHAKDMEFLLVLPVNQSMVTAVKLTQAAAYSAFINLLFFGPALFAFAFLSKQSPLFFLYTLLGIPLATLLPFALALIPILLLIRFTRFAHNRDHFTMVSSVLVILMVVGFSLFSQNRGQSQEAFVAPEWMVGNAWAGNPLSYLLPSLPLFSLSLLHAASMKGLLNFLLLLVSSLIFCAVCYAVASAVYIPGALRVAGGNAAAGNKKVGSRDFRRRSPILALAANEAKLLLRTPVFMTQCLLPALLVPALVLGGTLFPLLKNPQIFSRMDHFISSVRQIFSTEDSSFAWLILITAGLAFGLFQSGLSSSGMTAISRQGKSFWQLKAAPIKASQVIYGLLLPAYSISLLVWIPILAIVLSLGILPFSAFLLLAFLALLAIYLTQTFGLVFDLMMPRIDWESEIQAVKNSPSVLIGSFGSMLMAFAYGAICYLGLRYLPDKLWLVGAALILLSLALCVLATFLVFRFANRLLSQSDCV